MEKKSFKEKWKDSKYVNEYNKAYLDYYMKENNISYNKIYSERPSLNDVFLELTGKDLRD